MIAKTPEDLKQLIEDNPEEYASSFLDDGSFAFHCYSNHTYEGIRELFETGTPDTEECKTWGLSEVEWKLGVEMAFIAQHSEVTG